MQCTNCNKLVRRNLWLCPKCGEKLEGGIVFVSSISGSGTDIFLKAVESEAKSHGHKVKIFDVGEIMRQYAEEDDPDVKWDRILDADDVAIRRLRKLAFQELKFEIREPDVLHIVDLHLSFRWKAYLTGGIEQHIIKEFSPKVRVFVNLIEDLLVVQERLEATSWGRREILELIVWKDEELFLTDLFANICGRVKSFALSINEPPSMLERMIWHSDQKRVYLSFPITNILGDEEAKEEIEKFRDVIREFLVVFDPYATKDYDEAYKRDEMESFRPEIGEITKARDYRFIDQADAVVVYYPKKVDSKGVDAEMNHAMRKGKTIFLYCPEDLGGGPFAVEPGHYSNNKEEFIEILAKELS